MGKCVGFGPASPDELHPLLNGVVGVSIHDQGVVAGYQGRQDAVVGQRDGRVDQGTLGLEPLRQFLLGLHVRGHAGECSRRSVVSAPSLQSAAHGILDSRVLVQPEETVRPEVDHPAAVQLGLSVRTDGFERHVLQEQAGITLEGRLEVVDEGIVFERLRQPFDQVGHEPVPMNLSINLLRSSSRCKSSAR